MAKFRLTNIMQIWVNQLTSISPEILTYGVSFYTLKYGEFSTY